MGVAVPLVVVARTVCVLDETTAHSLSLSSQDTKDSPTSSWRQLPLLPRPLFPLPRLLRTWRDTDLGGDARRLRALLVLQRTVSITKFFRCEYFYNI